MKNIPSTRRQFIRNVSAGVAAFTIIPRHVLGGPGFVAPSEKVNIAVIGAGGMGLTNLKALFLEEDAQVIAIADPAESYEYEVFYRGKGGRKPMAAAVEEHYRNKTPNFRCADYEDFRVMLEKEKNIDAVLCATPDHLHAYVSAIAMRAGKHLYCEKPMAHNIAETRFLRQLAKETGVATQMGNQGMSTPGIRQTVEAVRSGVIGTIKKIKVWVPYSRWLKELVARPTNSMPVPTGLNWDLWLGPREFRPFHSCYAHVTWRDFWEFGTGALGDFGCHDLAAPLWAFDFATPTCVEASVAGMYSEELQPHGSIVRYDFPTQGAQPAIELTWYDGGLQPAKPASLERFPFPRRGALYIGEKGAILTEGSGAAPRIFPAPLRGEYKRPSSRLPLSKGHHRDWIDACKGGPAPASNFDDAARLTELVYLGVIAQRTRQPIVWDAATMTAKGLPHVAPIVHGTYRPGWEVV